MFSKAKVGDRVWSLLHGWGTVDENVKDQRYSVYVKFDNGREDTFTNCGRNMTFHANPTLFWDKVKITPPPPKLEVDTPILVKDGDDEDWRPAHFARFPSEGVLTWMGGRTSHTAGDAVFWEQWKLPEVEKNQ